MKLQYNKFCFSESFKIEDQEVESESPEMTIAVETLFQNIVDKHGSAEMFKLLLQSYGEYEESTRCEQCGDYDEIINIEI